MRIVNTDDCSLHVVFDNVNGLQQIRLYKDSGFKTLVAIGQGLVGTIFLEEEGNSGISGSVEWDGTTACYDFATLDCFPSSSSS